MKARLSILVFLAMATLASVVMADRLGELQERFKQRFAAIRALKDEGKIGETTQGLLEAVKGDLESSEQALVTEENADREELYRVIAEQEKTSPEVVARRAAIRNFERAKATDWLKDVNGKWRQKSSARQ